MSLELKVKSFVEDTAEKLGVSTRTIERHLWPAEHLAPEAAKILKEMGKQQPSRSEVMKLARLEPDRQEEAASLLASGTIKSIAEYLKQSETTTPKVEEKDSSDTVTCFDMFMDFSNKVLNNLKRFRTSFATDSAALASDEREAIQTQADKLHQAITRLAAQINGGEVT